MSIYILYIYTPIIYIYIYTHTYIYIHICTCVYIYICCGIVDDHKPFSLGNHRRLRVMVDSFDLEVACLAFSKAVGQNVWDMNGMI